MSVTSVKRALLSVSDKTNLIELATALSAHQVEILSSGGTCQHLRDAGIAVTEIADYTGFPEILGGRVKTLHPKVHGGLLRREGDEATLAEHDIKPIDLLVINLYPFEQTIANPEHSFAEAIEKIDIGGPTMLRAAAKNFKLLSVLTSPSDYSAFIAELNDNKQISEATRFNLAKKAFIQIAHYDALITNYFCDHAMQNDDNQSFPEVITKQFKRKSSLRYGENPHQNAALYQDAMEKPNGIATATQLQGKPLSYNNLVDADTAWQMIQEQPFGDQACCVIVKHANPCGVAYGTSLTEAYDKAFASDSESAFGGIIAVNMPLDIATTEAIFAKQFVEIIIAPAVDDAAKTLLAEKPNLRVLTAELDGDLAETHYQQVSGGFLVQDADEFVVDQDSWQVVTAASPFAGQYEDLIFANWVCRFAKSNAIVYAKNKQTLGIGVGQTSRVASAEFGAQRAKQFGFSLEEAVVASDAFYPFRDGVDTAAEKGVKAIIQPGGSMRDGEVIAAADEHQVAMVFTGERHFKH